MIAKFLISSLVLAIPVPTPSEAEQQTADALLSLRRGCKLLLLHFCAQHLRANGVDCCCCIAARVVHFACIEADFGAKKPHARAIMHSNNTAHALLIRHRILNASRLPLCPNAKMAKSIFCGRIM